MCYRNVYGMQVGGDGHIVEIDETSMKRNRNTIVVRGSPTTGFSVVSTEPLKVVRQRRLRMKVTLSRFTSSPGLSYGQC